MNDRVRIEDGIAGSAQAAFQPNHGGIIQTLPPGWKKIQESFGGRLISGARDVSMRPRSENELHRVTRHLIKHVINHLSNDLIDPSTLRPQCSRSRSECLMAADHGAFPPSRLESLKGGICPDRSYARLPAP